ncbi:sigma factor-like helix-turn-helix DNA-binding protein [Streptomyces sp. NPDC050636]|uniref:sigma factor-like helix-turn-helix DNA-binding protein n=1 Tax=Streptomyces sp. NPDC050636 TaxID=3154510 RepID=UPI0034245A48
MAAFGALSAIWADVLRSSCPSAVSWRVLSHAVSAVRSASADAVDVDALHDVLPVRQADAVLLRYRLGMPLVEVADLMGVDESALAVLLREAERTLRGASSPL